MARIWFLQRTPSRTRTMPQHLPRKLAKRHEVVIDPKNPKRAILSIGDEEWPFRFPSSRKRGNGISIPRRAARRFCSGASENNELDAITICRGFVEAQKEYAQQIHDNSGVNQYAQRIISTPGKQDGLAWRNPDGSLGRSRRRSGSEGSRRRLRG